MYEVVDHVALSRSKSRRGVAALLGELAYKKRIDSGESMPPLPLIDALLR